MMTLNSILEFIRLFVGWQEEKKPPPFDILSQQQYRDGILLRVSRESITQRTNTAQVSTLVWIPKNKNNPYLYLFLDSFDGLNLRNLSHRIQVLSSDRYLSGDSVRTNIHLSQSYFLGTHKQATTVISKLFFYCRDRAYDSIDWNWEVEAIRKQLLGYTYTNETQLRARENYRFTLDRYELRYSAPRSLNPILIEKITEIIEPKPPPKSWLIEILIAGGVLIGIAVLVTR
jgi:hypothetical protein